MTVLTKDHEALPSGEKLRRLLAGAVVLPDGFQNGADFIVVRFQTGKTRFSASSLVRFLSFLELAVFHERLIFGSMEFEVDLEPELFTDDLIAYTQQKWAPKGTLDISANAISRLQEEGALLRRQLPKLDESPRELLLRFSALSPALLKAQEVEKRDGFDDLLPVLSEHQWKELGHYLAMVEYGEALVASEYSRECGVPFHHEDTKELRLTEEAELSTREGVLSMLRNQLSRGARAELDRLSRLGTVCMFPRTPVALQILRRSREPEDLIESCLDLREEWAGFRRQMIEIEEQLLSEDITLARKLRLLSSLEAAASEVWKQPLAGGLRQVIKEISGLVPLLSSAIASPVPGSTASAVRAILGLPVETILRALRRRKLRVLHEAKKGFLQSAGLSTHLAEMFEVPQEVVCAESARYGSRVTSSRIERSDNDARN